MTRCFYASIIHFEIIIVLNTSWPFWLVFFSEVNTLVARHEINQLFSKGDNAITTSEKNKDMRRDSTKQEMGMQEI